MRVKAGLGSGGHPVRFLGFGSTLATVQRIEFSDVDFYHNANVTLAISSDVATTDLTVAVSDSQYSFNGGALAAFNTSTNISTTVTRSGSVTTILEDGPLYASSIAAGTSYVFGPFTIDEGDRSFLTVSGTISNYAFGSEIKAILDPVPDSNSSIINMNVSGDGAWSTSIADTDAPANGPWTGTMEITATDVDITGVSVDPTTEPIPE